MISGRPLAVWNYMDSLTFWNDECTHVLTKNLGGIGGSFWDGFVPTIKCTISMVSSTC